MNDQEIAKKITGYLDRGTAGLRAGTAFKLQRARQEALARLSAPQHTPEFTFAGAGGATFGGGRRFLADARIWIGLLLLVGGLISYQYWQAAQQARDIEETDAAILSSELPIEAYLDRGFQAWLKRSEP
ncbi:MAG: DUF3619 family protein [Pseudomonadota bacterium]|nr:DUF3619 family protein [Pseudomonadota bacterium]